MRKHNTDRLVVFCNTRLVRLESFSIRMTPGTYSLDVTGMGNSLRYAIELTGVTGIFAIPLPAADGRAIYPSFRKQLQNSARPTHLLSFATVTAAFIRSVVPIWFSYSSSFIFKAYDELLRALIGQRPC